MCNKLINILKIHPIWMATLKKHYITQFDFSAIFCCIIIIYLVWLLYKYHYITFLTIFFLYLVVGGGSLNDIIILTSFFSNENRQVKYQYLQQSWNRSRPVLFVFTLHKVFFFKILNNFFAWIMSGTFKMKLK